MSGLRRAWSGWRLALRLGRREALRARGRSVLVLVMIALPVLAVVTTAVLAATVDVSAKEGLDRKLGTKAAAMLIAQARVKNVRQGIDPTQGGTWSDAPGRPAATRAQVTKVLGDRPMLPVTLDASVGVRTKAGVAAGAQVSELDPTDPLAAGLFRLTDGRWPRSRDEVVVNAYLAGRGPGLGSALTLPSHQTGEQPRKLRVVGIAESASVKNKPAALGLPGSFHLPPNDGTTWLVGGGPIGWDDVLALNRLGVTALSRAVVLDPPAAAVTPAPTSSDGTTTVYALVAVMALIEVVLLAGPAFAVGARRQSRSLALMAASGSTPRQARRVVLGSAVVLGGVAGAIAFVGGLALARVLEPVVQHYTGDWLGPFEIPWLEVVGIAAFGIVSALLAALVPAWIASRQDVVAVLAGRRGEGRASMRSPVLGLVLLALGIAGAVASARRTEGGEVYIAGAAILCVLGMVLLVPVVVATVGRVAARFPLPLRFAARDAARHRTRTAPAVAAVAATVAGVVALGIGNASDEKGNRETYVASLPIGQGVVTGQTDGDTDWPKVRDLVARYAPGATTSDVVGVPEDGGGADYRDLSFWAGGEQQFPDTYGIYNVSTLVAAGHSLPDPVTTAGISVDGAAARDVLSRGGVVVFTSQGATAHEAAIRVRVTDNDTGRLVRSVRARVPALFVDVGSRVSAPAQAVASPEALRKVGLRATTAALLLHGPVPKTAEEDLSEALTAMGEGVDYPTVYVERGYQPTSYAWLIQVILGILGAILMLGGTLTATFLALSDARPDLATLSAVGAAPRTRRGIAASYAVVVALVGSVLGALVGLVPGIAVTYPLTRTTGGPHGVSGPFIDIPWLLIVTVVVGLPLLVAATVAVATRSRLPLVARLD